MSQDKRCCRCRAWLTYARLARDPWFITGAGTGMKIWCGRCVDSIPPGETVWILLEGFDCHLFVRESAA